MNIADNICCSPLRERMWDDVTEEYELWSHEHQTKRALNNESISCSSKCKCILGVTLAIPFVPLFIPPAMVLQCVQSVRSSPYCSFDRRSICLSCCSIGLEGLVVTTLSIRTACTILFVVPLTVGNWCAEKRVRLLFRERFCKLICSDLPETRFPVETLERELLPFVSRYAEKEARLIVDRIDSLRQKVLNEALEPFPNGIIGVISSYLLPISKEMAELNDAFQSFPEEVVGVISSYLLPRSLEMEESINTESDWLLG